MSDLGLKYGDEFRSVRELAAGNGRSMGRVTLSDASAIRAEDYPLHPVLLDGALHVLSAGRSTVEARGSQLKLPVRFGRILFLRSPGASARVRASVIHCNDEYFEGRIELYDEGGKPCVLVDGFRAISVAGVRRGTSGGIRDVLYHVDWERTPTVAQPGTSEPLPLSHLRDAAQSALDDVLAIRGRARLGSAIAAQDDLAAALLCAGLREMGVQVDCDFSADSLRIVPPMQPVFEQLMMKLRKRGLLEAKPVRLPGDALVRDCRGFRARGAESVRRGASWPSARGFAGDGQLCRARSNPAWGKGRRAGAFRRGGCGAPRSILWRRLLTSHWLAAISATFQKAARALPEGRGLRILEVGAGTGGLSAQVLPALERGVHSYTFSDVSAAFFSGAMQKLAAYREVETKIFDLEKPAIEQDFEPASFDFIIGTNVLHAVADVRTALRNLHELLVPGGSLVFMDVATPQLWTEAVFGLTSGWWRFTDRDLRPVHPLLGREHGRLYSARPASPRPRHYQAWSAHTAKVKLACSPARLGRSYRLPRRPWNPSPKSRGSFSQMNAARARRWRIACALRVHVAG
jgi:SAM-dependent methyltransferase